MPNSPKAPNRQKSVTPQMKSKSPPPLTYDEWFAQADSMVQQMNQASESIVGGLKGKLFQLGPSSVDFIFAANKLCDLIQRIPEFQEDHDHTMAQWVNYYVPILKTRLDSLKAFYAHPDVKGYKDHMRDKLDSGLAAIEKLNARIEPLLNKTDTTLAAEIDDARKAAKQPNNNRTNKP